MTVTPELLKKFPILKELSNEKLTELSKASEISRASRRAMIMTSGEQVSSICFLFEGRLQGVDFTIDGREVGLYFVEPGEFCGEIALFDSGTQPEHVIALTPAVIVSVSLSVMRGIMFQEPAIVSALGIKLASRIRQMNFQRSLLALPNINQRVCCQLWSLVCEEDKTGKTFAVINNPPTHMEIAIMLNVSRETVSRVFQNLQNKKIVRRSGSLSLQITNLETLQKLAAGDIDPN